MYMDVSRRAVIDVTLSSEDSKMTCVDESHLRGLEPVVGVRVISNSTDSPCWCACLEVSCFLF